MAAQRFGFIDWYRGLACVLMFQTHAYDAWVAEPYRGGYWWWLARPFLGGFPARMFLLLAGVSLMLRFAGDLRRGKTEAEARRGAAGRGFEVFLLGYAFRVGEWLIGGARPSAAWALLKFDVLQCIGATLMISAFVAAPRDTQPGQPPPLRPLLAALLVALGTPLLQKLGHPPQLPAWLPILLWGDHDLMPFPLLPWVSYTLTGCCVGAYLLRGSAAGTLGRTVVSLAILGAVIGAVGKLGGRVDIPIYRPTAAVPIPATPVSYLFRSGTCVLGLACAYWLEQWRSRRAAGPSTDGPPAGWRAAWARFTPLLWLGQASMTVYMVHLDLVYNIWSYPIKHKLTPAAASALLGLLTALMIWLAYYRTARHARPRSRPVLASSAAVAPVNPLSKPKAS